MDKYNSTPKQVSLTLTRGGYSKGEMNHNRRERDKTKVEGEYDSKLERDDVVKSRSGDDQDNSHHERRKHYQKHTPQQQQELEEFFKEYPHPDENQRLQLSKMLNLTPSQIKFWFQNRRTLIKAKLEHHDNTTLRGKHERILMENRSLKEAMTNNSCYNYGGLGIVTEMPLEERQLWIDNVRLRIEVTSVEHIDYADRGVDNMYHSFVNSGLAFGSQRWLSTLQHECERLAHMEINADITAFPDPGGQQNLLKLAQRMTRDFCACLSPSVVHSWATLSDNGGDEDIRVSTRKNTENPGFTGRVVLCAATSVWLPVTPKKSFDFLRDLKRRSQWDIFSTSEPKQEITCIVKGQDPGNSVSLFASNGINTSQTAFILQECCTDGSACIIVYAPVDMASMDAVMHGGEPDHVSVFPSGFVILPDGLGTLNQIESTLSNTHRGGSILTVVFQILLANMETPRPAMEDVQVVQRLISHTLQKIRSALILEDA